jgi:hypothetical protein
MSIKNRIVFKGKLKDYPGAEALSSTAMVTGNTATVGLNTDRGKGVTICKAKIVTIHCMAGRVAGTRNIA